MNNIEELKPCPFCGGKAHLLTSNGSFLVECSACLTDFLNGPVGIGWYRSEKDAAADWNDRPSERALIAQLEAAQKERDEATQRLIRYSMSAGEADQRRCESRAVRDELGFEKDADDVAPIDLRNAIVAIRDRAEKAEAELSAANEKLSKPVELSSNWIDPASVWNDDEPTMPVDEVIKAIKAAGFTVEGE